MREPYRDRADRVTSFAPNHALIALRPFRSPHHTVSEAALVGGGKYPSLGELNPTHYEMLFQDDLPEFKKNVLEVLHHPNYDPTPRSIYASASISTSQSGSINRES
jgi:hypothetical protein